MARILCKGGRGLIYVWSFQHQKLTYPSQEALVPWHLKPQLQTSATIPTHASSSSSEVVLLRYYHLFVEGELEKLILEDEGDVVGTEDSDNDTPIHPLPPLQYNTSPASLSPPPSPFTTQPHFVQPSRESSSSLHPRYPPLRNIVRIIRSGFDHENWFCVVEKI